jgi:hypothetical protein
MNAPYLVANMTQVATGPILFDVGALSGSNTGFPLSIQERSATFPLRDGASRRVLYILGGSTPSKF